MPDLKEMLRPLDETEMPDRWDVIRRRPVTPLPERRRSRMPVFAVSAAVAALAIAVVAGLLPLGDTAHERQPGATEQPPSWLVEQAYRFAYANGDMLPDSAEWALLPRSAIPTPVGNAGAGSNKQEYVLVLHGRFTAYEASVPAGAPLPTGTLLTEAFDGTTHEVTDWGLDNGDPGIDGLQPFSLPPRSSMFASPEGWTAAVPPGWTTGAIASDGGDPTPPGSFISNTTGFRVGGQPSLPQATSIGFPNDGLTIVVSRVATPADQRVLPLPLSADELAKGSGMGSTLDSAYFQTGDQVFVVTVRTGQEASPQDLRAADDVIASIALAAAPSTAEGSTANSEPSAAEAAVPSARSVVDGHFIESVELDGGLLRVDPPPMGYAMPAPGRIADLLWASSAFQGKNAVTIGYGLITMKLAQHSIAKVESVPGWIAFANGGAFSCPAMTAAPSAADLPTDGFVAVSDISSGINFAYTAAADRCGTVTDPSVELASHVESVPWDLRGPVTNNTVDIRYSPPACGHDAVYTLSGGAGVYTFEVDMSVANDPLPCPYPQPVETSVQLTGDGSGTTATEIRHAPTGLVRQAQGVT